MKLLSCRTGPLLVGRSLRDGYTPSAGPPVGREDGCSFVGEGGYAGEDFAFEELEAGSAAGGDVGDTAGDAGLLDGSDRVSASDNRGGVVVAGDGVGDGVGALREGGHLEDAHGAVPDDGAGFGDLLFEEGDGFGADVEGHEVCREGTVAGEDLGFGVGGELVGEDVVDGEEEANTFGLCLGEGGFGDVEFVGFDEGFAGGLALRVEEGVGHAAADDDGVGFGWAIVEEVVDDADLVGDLGAADDGDEGLVGFGEGLAHVGELFLHEEAGGGFLDEVGDAFGGGVGAVCAAEGVVDVDVAEGGELFAEGGVVGLFFGVEAEVFEQEWLAGFEVGGHLAGDLADAVRGEGYVFVVAEDVVEEGAEVVDEGAKAHGLDGLAFRAAEVGAENDFGFVAEGVLDGGEGLADAGVVGDDAVFEGDVEVDADEYALVGEIQIANGELWHCSSFGVNWAGKT
jgi:hypothetical protein